MGQRGQTVQKARSRHRQTHTRLARQIARTRGGVACVLLVAERQHAHTLSLHHAAQIGDWNTGNVINGVQTIQLERVDHKVKAVRQVLFHVNSFSGFACHVLSP